MSNQILCKVREVAEKVVASDLYFHSPELLQILPDKLLELGLADHNISYAKWQIDVVRREKEWELIGGREGRTRMPGYLKECVKEIISDPDYTQTLSADLQQKVKEILFLFGLADAVIQILYPSSTFPNNISQEIGRNSDV